MTYKQTFNDSPEGAYASQKESGHVARRGQRPDFVFLLDKL